MRRERRKKKGTSLNPKEVLLKNYLQHAKAYRESGGIPFKAPSIFSDYASALYYITKNSLGNTLHRHLRVSVGDDNVRPQSPNFPESCGTPRVIGAGGAGGAGAVDYAGCDIPDTGVLGRR
ncbi:hypothetical protein EVAR_37737_1 [Eumeta japonica]|uniref:Uncharacterized protein n=1 Tax=Eumeta variegata TaxID=151549 RepID=A0A4C1WM40_EUMVA|nr:hypothetical protein EVAR_37737_1 [Eumeta japonica]